MKDIDVQQTIARKDNGRVEKIVGSKANHRGQLSCSHYFIIDHVQTRGVAFISIGLICLVQL